MHNEYKGRIDMKKKISLGLGLAFAMISQVGAMDKKEGPIEQKETYKDYKVEENVSCLSPKLHANKVTEVKEQLKKFISEKKLVESDFYNLLNARTKMDETKTIDFIITHSWLNFQLFLMDKGLANSFDDDTKLDQICEEIIDDIGEKYSGF